MSFYGCSVNNYCPSQFVKFEYNLLLYLKKETISLSSAVKIVEDVKKKRKAIEKLIQEEKMSLTSKSFYFKTFELRKKMLKTNHPSNGLKHLISQLEDLNLIVTKNFGISF